MIGADLPLKLLGWLRTRVFAWWPFLVSGGLVIACYGVSKYGVDRAIKTCSASDGGRGGAVAVMIAIFVIFVTPSYATRLYRNLDKSHKQNGVFTIGMMLEALDDDEKYVRLQNLFLATATLIGTYFWGFGDQIAQRAINVLPACKH